MTVSPATLAAFRAEIGDITCHDDPKYVGLKSRDYYWYSPILSAELDGRAAQLVVQPRTEAEVITIAAANNLEFNIFSIVLFLRDKKVV